LIASIVATIAAWSVNSSDSSVAPAAASGPSGPVDARGEGAGPTCGDYACGLTPRLAAPPAVKTSRRSPASIALR
jgi:hypothetical protein